MTSLPNQQSPHFPDCFYRVTVKGLCVKEDKLLLVREDESMGGAWELPGGGLDFGEDIQTTFEREVREEMGMTVKYMSNRPLYVWPVKLHSKRSLTWYYTLLLAYVVDFDHFDFTPTEECRELGWFTREELAALPLCDQTKPLPDFFNLKDFKKQNS